MFRPPALLFAGVAGAVKDDIHLGDIVVATKVYAYHGGKDEDDGFLARPRAWDAPHELDQLARYIARTASWTRLLAPTCRDREPVVHFKPIAAGEVVLNSRDTPLARQLHRAYNDAAAIEMESAGVSQAGHLNRSLPVLTVRGISDKADGAKRTTDEADWQSTAAAAAAAFVVTLAAEIIPDAASANTCNWIVEANPGLWLRSGPGRHYPTIDWLDYGQLVCGNCTGVESGGTTWYRLRRNGDGWAWGNSAYLQPAQSPKDGDAQNPARPASSPTVTSPPGHPGGPVDSGEPGTQASSTRHNTGLAPAAQALDIHPVRHSHHQSGIQRAEFRSRCDDLTRLPGH
jgi:nucleoside phosphorylase